MEQMEVSVALFAIIIIVGVVFRKTSVPASLILVIVGMGISFIPYFPSVKLQPGLVLNIFLPLLIYEASANSSWKDVKTNMRPIVLLSVGHVIFITFLVAIVMHGLIPQMGWPLAFLLGAVISPPDDVAIIPIAEKTNLPRRVITILKSEGMLNDAAALTLFRFALVAVIAHEFSVTQAITTFILVIVGETLYGFVLGHIIGRLRLLIQDSSLQMLASFSTPFLAYLPVVQLGGSGILSTVVTGLVIGQVYLERYPPEVRLIGRAFWITLGFALQSILFLLIGLNLREIIPGISAISFKDLAIYSASVILTIIIGRFFWVFAAAYVPRFLFPKIRRKDPYPLWQYPFIISWAGLRGAISLAAAFAVPALPPMENNIHPNDLLTFLVFAVIVATLLLQGLTLPRVIKVLGASCFGLREHYDEHLIELSVRLKMIKAALRWLSESKELAKDDPKLLDEINMYIKEYRLQKDRLKERIEKHDQPFMHDEPSELREAIHLSSELIEVQRKKLLSLWRQGKVTYEVKTKLMQQLDHLSRHLT